MRLLQFASKTTFGILIKDRQIELIQQNEIFEAVTVQIAKHQVRAFASNIAGNEFRFGEHDRAGTRT